MQVFLRDEYPHPWFAGHLEDTVILHSHLTPTILQGEIIIFQHHLSFSFSRHQQPSTLDLKLQFSTRF